MLARIVMVTAIALLVLLVGAPEDAVACHRGDPLVPHGNQTSCDGGGGVTPTDFVLVDANGDVVGPVINYGPEHLRKSLANLQVIASTQDQRLFFLTIQFDILSVGRGFQPQGQLVVRFELLGCEGDAYISAANAVPNVFYEHGLLPDGTGGSIPFVGTSFEIQFLTSQSRIQPDGSCYDTQEALDGYPAERLTDEFGDPIFNIDDLYPPPLRIEVK